MDTMQRISLLEDIWQDRYESDLLFSESTSGYGFMRGLIANWDKVGLSSFADSYL